MVSTIPLLVRPNGRPWNTGSDSTSFARNCRSDVILSPPLDQVKVEAAKLGHINKGAKIHFKLDEVENRGLRCAMVMETQNFASRSPATLVPTRTVSMGHTALVSDTVTF